MTVFAGHILKDILHLIFFFSGKLESSNHIKVESLSRKLSSPNLDSRWHKMPGCPPSSSLKVLGWMARMSSSLHRITL